MFSNFYSKRWSSASITLVFLLGLFCGLFILAFEKDSNRAIWGLIPMGLFVCITIWFMCGEENEWIKQRDEYVEKTNK